MKLDDGLIAVLRKIINDKCDLEDIRNFVVDKFKRINITLKEARYKIDDIDLNNIPKTGDGNLPILRAALWCALTGEDYEYGSDACSLIITDDANNVDDGTEKITTSPASASSPASPAPIATASSVASDNKTIQLVECNGDEDILQVLKKEISDLDDASLNAIGNIFRGKTQERDPIVDTVIKFRQQLFEVNFPDQSVCPRWEEVKRFIRRLVVVQKLKEDDFGDPEGQKRKWSRSGGKKKTGGEENVASKTRELPKPPYDPEALLVDVVSAFSVNPRRGRETLSNTLGKMAGITISEARGEKRGELESRLPSAGKGMITRKRTIAVLNNEPADSIQAIAKKKDSGEKLTEKKEAAASRNESTTKKEQVEYDDSMTVSALFNKFVHSKAAMELRNFWRNDSRLNLDITLDELRNLGPTVKKRYFVAITSETRKKQVQEIHDDVQITPGKRGGVRTSTAEPTTKKKETKKKATQKKDKKPSRKTQPGVPGAAFDEKLSQPLPTESISFNDVAELAANIRSEIDSITTNIRNELERLNGVSELVGYLVRGAQLTKQEAIEALNTQLTKMRRMIGIKEE
ncbi:hypothetical protein KKA15_02210 [Patescibacteria group bacterium]|nr:hypothetical protein [Patescibacteria group bacterium]